jgi:hypothetical protein
MLKGVKFQEFHATCEDITQLIPFVCAFYAFEFPLFYNHHIMKVMSHSSHLPWEPVKMILWEDIIRFSSF